jgi:hypothetical protein
MDSTASSVMTTLVEAGNIDTIYRDVYLDRARTFLAPVLSLENFHRLEQERVALAELPLTIARALDNGNWSLVKELSERAEALKHAIEDKGGLLQTARSVYDVRDVRLDPFSPGLQPFTRIPQRELAALRTRVVGLLGELQRADGAWNDFYAARRRAFEAQRQRASETDTASSSETDALESARQALKSGDMKRLAALAAGLATEERPADRRPCAPRTSDLPRQTASRVRGFRQLLTPMTRWPGRASWDWRRVMWKDARNLPRFDGTRGRHCPTSRETAPPLSCRCRPDPPRVSRKGWWCSRSTRS